MSNLSLGLMLMGIGMVTVFAILLIVIFGSQGIISVVNRLVPSTEPVLGKDDVDPTVKDILEKAVSQITGGRGHIINITKIK